MLRRTVLISKFRLGLHKKIFSRFVNVSGFTNFGVFGFVGVSTKRILGFGLNVYTRRQLWAH